MSDVKPKLKKGFALMDPELRREVARKGGLNTPAESRSFSKDPDKAREAGRKGGATTRERYSKKVP